MDDFEFEIISLILTPFLTVRLLSLYLESAFFFSAKGQIVNTLEYVEQLLNSTTAAGKQPYTVRTEMSVARFPPPPPPSTPK